MAPPSSHPHSTCLPHPRGAESPSPQSLVLEYLPLVRLLAWQIYGSLPAHAAIELSDVVQAGHVGLVNASHSFNPAGPVPFASFARHRIRGEILDSLRRLDSASRGLRRWQRRMDIETRNLTHQLSREPSDEEISARLGVEVVSLRKRRLKLWYTSSCAPAVPGANEPEWDAQSVPATADWRPDLQHQRAQTRQFLVRAVAILPPRSRKVVLLYYLKNLTMKQIGLLLNVNESRVSQIHKHALETLGRGLRAAGVSSLKDFSEFV